MVALSMNTKYIPSDVMKKLTNELVAAGHTVSVHQDHENLDYYITVSGANLAGALVVLEKLNKEYNT
jgi:predicted transcriptional regulator